MQLTIILVLMGLAGSGYGNQSASMKGYLGGDNMSEKCKRQLKAEMKSWCESSEASGYSGLQFGTHNVCTFTCTGQRGRITQHVKLQDGLPCGSHGETCKDGKCTGGKTPDPNKCPNQFVRESPYVSSWQPRKEK